MKEADLKRVVWDYLQYGMNQGKWYFDRLNSGAIYEKRGDRTYGVMLCREGTADFMVLQYYRKICGGAWGQLRVFFLELKGDKGKTSPAQDTFKTLVEGQGAEYFVIRSIEDVITLLE